MFPVESEAESDEDEQVPEAEQREVEKIEKRVSGLEKQLRVQRKNSDVTGIQDSKGLLKAAKKRLSVVKELLLYSES